MADGDTAARLFIYVRAGRRFSKCATRIGERWHGKCRLFICARMDRRFSRYSTKIVAEISSRLSSCENEENCVDTVARVVPFFRRKWRVFGNLSFYAVHFALTNVRACVFCFVWIFNFYAFFLEILMRVCVITWFNRYA